MKGLPPISESAFQRQVVQLAVAFGWRWFHVHDSRRSNAGFPDLVLVRPSRGGRVGRTLFVELKTEKGRLRVEQVAWLADLAAAGQEAYCWRPSSWDDIERLLA